MGWGTKVCFNDPGHMTSMAAMPMFDKNLKNLLLWNQKTADLESCMQHWVLENYQVCSNDDPWLTLTCFTARSNLVPYTFVRKKVKTMAFSETIVVYDIKVGRCSQLKEYMNLYE